MYQLELFDSAIVFAIHHDRDELQKLRKTNKEAALKVLWVRELIGRMASASKYEDYRHINHVNNTLNKFLANKKRQRMQEFVPEVSVLIVTPV